MGPDNSITGLPLPAYVDREADINPNGHFAELCLEDGRSEAVSNKQLAVAVNKAAWWLDERLRHLYLSRTFAFVATGSDLRYWILMLAAAKTGRLAFFTSPRNDSDAHRSLFQAYTCKILLLPTGSSFRYQLQDVIEAESLACIEVPDLDFFFSFAPDPYAWNWSPRTILSEPLVGSHSSGSTGLPKPIKIKHGCPMAMERWKQLPELGHGAANLCTWAGKRVLLGLPLFHAAALCAAMAAVQNRFTLILPPAGPRPVNAQMIASIVSSTKVDIVFTSPSVLAEMAADRRFLDALSKVQVAAFGGGPLPEHTGETIRRRTTVLNVIGMTEMGILPCEVPEDRDWQYTHFSPVIGIEMRPAADELFDLFVVRNQSCKDFQVAFYTFPELTEYGSGDLFSRHPSKSGLWKWEGRKDDIVVYSTGEKFNPTAMEDDINGHPLIAAALVCGKGKPHSALLVEPASAIDAKEIESFVDKIWTHIKAINSNTPAHARIMKDMILSTASDKPLPRAGKGTVQRKAALQLYAAELDALYESPAGKRKDSKVSTLSETQSPATSLASPTPISPRTVPELGVHSANANFATQPERHEDTGPNVFNMAHQILESLQRSLGLAISIDNDFFSAGLDSLGVTTIVRELQRNLHLPESSVDKVEAKAVYEHSTPLKLASFLCSNEADAKDVQAQMQALLEKYTMDLPVTARETLPVDQSRKVVVLTGSTGSFGTHVLDALLHDDSVAEIICLNRRHNAEKDQARSLIRKGLSANFERKLVSFVRMDLSRPHLGLELDEYRQLLSKATHIIHNAWHVNFNLSLDHFEKPHIQGVRQMIDFSARSRHGAMVFFISSIGAVTGYGQSRAADNRARAVPEIPIDDWSAATDESGYGQSKLVAERTLSAAASEAQVPCAICRVGQIAGPSTGDGEWLRNEWLPSLVVSSTNMGCLPASLGSFNNVDWVPIDLAAKTVLELVHHASKSPPNGLAKVYHTVNPRPTPWQSLIPALQSSLAIEKTVPLEEWIDMLAKLDDQDVNHYPAVKLLDFYRSLADGSGYGGVTLDTRESQRASWTLKELKPVTGEMLRGWARRWF